MSCRGAGTSNRIEKKSVSGAIHSIRYIYMYIYIRDINTYIDQHAVRCMYAPCHADSARRTVGSVRPSRTAAKSAVRFLADQASGRHEAKTQICCRTVTACSVAIDEIVGTSLSLY